MTTQALRGGATGLWRHVTRGRVMIAVVVVLSVLAVWLVLGTGNAATTSDAVTVDSGLAADLKTAAASCPALTPYRLAAQVMATTGFTPTRAGGIAGLSTAQWKTWAPSRSSSPANDEASILALAHMTCDLVGQVRVSGVTGDRWRLAVAASHSSIKAVKDANGVPATLTEFMRKVDGYVDFYGTQPLLGGTPAPTPTDTAPPTPTSTPALTPSRSASPNALAPPPSPTTTPAADPGLRLRRDSFADATGLTLNGTAHVTGGVVDLAAHTQEAGSVWASTAIDPGRSFETSFTAQISDITDGIAFLVQAQGPTAIGNPGGGLGYGGRSSDSARPITPSVAVEFDTWDNSPDGFDPAGHQHVAVTRSGDYSNHLIWRDPGFSMWGGTAFHVWISYDAGTRTVSVWISQTATKPGNPLFTYGVDLAAALGSGPAYVGFTGGTGLTTVTDEQESIQSWTFTSI